MCYCTNITTTTTTTTRMMKGETYYYNNNNEHVQEHEQARTDELISIIQGIEILNSSTTTRTSSSTFVETTSIISSLTYDDDDDDDDSILSSSSDDYESIFDDDAYHERGIIDDSFYDDHDVQGGMIHRRIKCSSLGSLKSSAQCCDSATKRRRSNDCSNSRSFLTTIYLNNVLDDCCEDLSSKIIHIHSKEHNHSNKACVDVMDGFDGNNDSNELSKKGDGMMTSKIALSKSFLPLKQVVKLVSSQEEPTGKYNNVTEKLKNKRCPPVVVSQSNNNTNNTSTRLQLMRAMQLLTKDNINRKEQQDDMTKKNEKKQMHLPTILIKKEEDTTSTNAALAKRRESSLRKLFMIPHNKKSSLSDLFQNKTSRAA